MLTTIFFVVLTIAVLLAIFGLVIVIAVLVGVMKYWADVMAENEIIGPPTYKGPEEDR